MKKTIGILGGMGPLATAELMKSITLLTDAKNDNEHLRVLADSNTNIPDRTQAILYGGADPRPQMIASANLLLNAGADFLVMPCNTAHYFLRDIAAHVAIPFISMIEETVREVVRLGVKTVGILSTSATAQSGVYRTGFEAQGITCLVPDEDEQQCVTDVIYSGVKAGNFSLDVTGLRHLTDRLAKDGAEVLILGCTELPIAFEVWNLPGKTLDPAQILAMRAIEFAGGVVKK